MEVIKLVGSPRTAHGKGEVRRLKQMGQVPAVVYGKLNQKKTISIQISRKELSHKVKFPIRSNQLYSLAVEEGGSKSKEEALVFLKDWQLNPTRTRWWEHLDFYAIRPEEKVRVLVPLKFVGMCKGVKNGGVLQPVRREVTVLGLPMDLPEVIEVDVSNLDIGKSIHVNEIPAPSKCSMVAATNFAVVAVVAPEEEVVEAVAAAPTTEAAAEGAVAEGEKVEATAAGEKEAASAEGKAEGKKDAKKAAEPKKEPKKEAKKEEKNKK